MTGSVLLGVNIDHVATLRQARGTRYPDPVYAAQMAEQAGADGITVHLREDRRHIQAEDVYRLQDALQTRLNLEMAVTEDMLKFALEVKPLHVCLQPIEGGQARLTYEVNLKPTAVGVGGPGLPFDSSRILDDPEQSSHQLEGQGSRYFTPVVEVSLRPDEYRFHEFARVEYAIDCTPQLDASGQVVAEAFDLVELEHEARGLSLIWNGHEVERLSRIHRDPHGLANFRTDRRRKTAKACIPGLNYGGYASMINNPGDPRISHYLRHMPLGENAYPENVSPHRRNIRRRRRMADPRPSIDNTHQPRLR